MKPHRSILSVPGHVAKMHAGAASSNADVVMLDLEDSVTDDTKNAARGEVIDALLKLDWSKTTVTVRINGMDTPWGWRDLTEVVTNAGHIVDAIVVPKVNHEADIHCIDRLLTGIELSTGRPAESGPIGIEVLIETAAGLERAAAITAASPRVRCLHFGLADYSASVGAPLVSISGHGDRDAKLYPGHRWHFAVSKMIMHAKAAGCLAIDAPYGDIKNAEGLRHAASMAHALGCDGKWAVHPSQISVINEVFTPSKDELGLAAKVLKAADEAAAHGLGAVAVDGRMVDQATVRLARLTWAHAKQLGLVN